MPSGSIRVMKPSALPLPFAGPGDALERAVGAHRRLARVEAEKVEHLVTYLRHAAAEAAAMDPKVSPGAERVCSYGGEGTPEIAEFTICEIGAALGLSQQSAARLVGDVLDIVYRLPILYAALEDGRVELWRLRKVASATRKLSEPLAHEVDIRLSAAGSVDATPLVGRASAARVQQIIDQVAGVVDPQSRDDEIEKNLADRFVEIRDGEPGVAELKGSLSKADAARMSQRLRIVAGWLAELGDERPIGVLRSEAAGWIAEPARLAMLHDQVLNHRQMTAQADEHIDTADTAGVADTTDAEEPGDGESEARKPSGGASSDGERAAGDADSERPLPEAFRRAAMPSTKLYLHWDRLSATFSLEGIGAISRNEAVDILNHSQITLTPVIDLNANPTYTGYVAPPRLKDQTALTNAGLCTFPSCGRQARACEYDHIRDHHAGGPTDARNGQRLCKHHHRCKTFTDWRVYSPAAGVWLWRSPKGRHYLVTAGTTTRLDTRPLDWAAAQPA